MTDTEKKKHNPLDKIVYISIPEDSRQVIDGFTMEPKILIPVEIPENSESWTLENLSWEMIVSAMLKIFAYDPTHKDISYYRDFINVVQPNLVAELTKTGVIKAEAKEFALAEEIFLALHNLAPEEDKTFLNLAFVYEEESDMYNQSGDSVQADYFADKAFHVYMKALEQHPESVDIHFYTGYFFLKQNNLSKAQEYFELFLGLAFDDERAPQVQEIVDQIRSQNEDDDLFAATFDLIKMGHEEEAIEKITQYLSRHPQVWNAWFLKGWAHRRLGQFQQGQDALLHCLDFEKSNTDVYNELAICCIETGDFKNARRHLHNALAIEPDNIKIISNLGVLELKQGCSEEAKKYFTVAAEIEPEDPIVKKYLEDLS